MCRDTEDCAYFEYDSSVNKLCHLHPTGITRGNGYPSVKCYKMEGEYVFWHVVCRHDTYKKYMQKPEIGIIYTYKFAYNLGIWEIKSPLFSLIFMNFLRIFYFFYNEKLIVRFILTCSFSYLSKI